MTRKSMLSVTIFVLLFCFVLLPSFAFGESAYLREGIEQYKLENYEESVDILIKARDKEPLSSMAAFLLGMAYKQIMDYPKAAENFKDAVTLTPRIKEALVELIEVLIRSPLAENRKEAGKWIEFAEKEGVLSARIAFLKGLALAKEGRNLEAVKAFEKAKSLDSSFSQPADFQIAVCYVKERKLEKAREQFKAVILFSPGTDLATFARQYQDVVERKIEEERPLRLTLGAFGQYNDNLTSTPRNNALAETLDMDYVETRALVASLRVNYLPFFEGPWLFNAQYFLSGNFNDKNSTSRDNTTSSLDIVPGYNFGRFSVNLPVSYSYSLLRGPGYEKYSDLLSIGPMLRMFLGAEQILELFAGYNREDFEPPLSEAGDRDWDGLHLYASWIWLFEPRAFLNMRYDFTDENAEGIWWENKSHKGSANATYPITDNFKLQVNGSVEFTDFDNEMPDGAFMTKREDTTYQGGLGITWEFYKNTVFIVQYSRLRVNSNIGIYDYERDLYTTGFELRY